MAETPIHHHNMTKKRLQRRAIHSLLGKTKKVSWQSDKRCNLSKPWAHLQRKALSQKSLEEFSIRLGLFGVQTCFGIFWKDDFVVIYIIWSLTSKCLKKGPPQKKNYPKDDHWSPSTKFVPSLLEPQKHPGGTDCNFLQEKSHQIRNHRFPPNH